MKKPKKSAPSKRDLIELGVIVVIFAVIYLTGSQAEVFGKVQQAVLSTGLISAGELDDLAKEKADYNFSLIDQNGQVLEGKSLKGRTIFLNIWATWCAPCVAEMPGINTLYNDLKEEEDLVFLMITHDKDFQKAKDWVAKKGFDFPIYRMNSRLPDVYETNVIPTTFVISKKEKIIVKHTGMADYNNRRFKKLLLKD